jgi:benzodiazapine receptor
MYHAPMTTVASSPFTRTRQVATLVGWLALCFAAASTGALVTMGQWFADLNKPSWNPPSWVFGPVWTLLYIAMAVAAWLVWRTGGWKLRAPALTAFMVQWLLNALWTPLFFGLHRVDLALVDIVLMWLAIAATIAMFYRISKPAAYLLVPYLAWVTFATALNFAIWRLNPT